MSTTTKQQSLTMTVSATEPISGTFPIELEGPGLYLLYGPPEAGKSNILDSLLFAYLRASGGMPKMERFRVGISFQAREKAKEAGGEAVGQITLPGRGGPAGVKVYESQIRKLPAPPTVQILDGSPFTQLTRNGLEDPKTKQAAELKAFAAITQVRAQAVQLVPEALASDVKDLEAPADAGPDLLPEVAKKVGKRLHDLKGRFLDDAEATGRKLNVCRDQTDVQAMEAPVGAVTAEQAALAAAEEKAAELRISRRGRERAEQQAQQFKALQLGLVTGQQLKEGAHDARFDCRLTLEVLQQLPSVRHGLKALLAFQEEALALQEADWERFGVAPAEGPAFLWFRSCRACRQVFSGRKLAFCERCGGWGILHQTKKRRGQRVDAGFLRWLRGLENCPAALKRV